MRRWTSWRYFSINSSQLEHTTRIDEIAQHHQSSVACSRAACRVCLFVRERKSTEHRNGEYSCSINLALRFTLTRIDWGFVLRILSWIFTAKKNLAIALLLHCSEVRSAEISLSLLIGFVEILWRNSQRTKFFENDQVKPERTQKYEERNWTFFFIVSLSITCGIFESFSDRIIEEIFI